MIAGAGAAGYEIVLEGWGGVRARERPAAAERERLVAIAAKITSVVGRDDRVEAKDAVVAASLLDAVAVLFDGPLAEDVATGRWKLPVRGLGLVSKARFSEQTAIAKPFTGFLVGPDLLLTASHAVGDPARLLVHFDYRLDAGGNEPAVVVEKSAVFGVRQVVDRDRKADWALLRLTATPAGRPIATVSATGPRTGDALWMLGHPRGLPMKFVDNGRVESTNGSFFTCGLDAAHGNSGSMIVDAASGHVVGVLVESFVDLDKSPTEPGLIWLSCADGATDCLSTGTSSAGFAGAVAAALAS